MPRKPPHYIWFAFVELAKRERLTALEAIDRLQDAFPYEPVEAIVRAEGDMSRSLAEVNSAPLPEPYQPQRQGSSTSQGNQGNQQGFGYEQQGQQIDPNDMNALIRQRAGRSSTTVTLPREAVTGVKGQAEYDPASDFIRSRFNERYGQD